MNTENWKHKDIWTRRGDNFCLEISRHPESPDDVTGAGPHRWCLYAYVYPRHPQFVKFSGPDILQPASRSMPLHRGPSYLHAHCDERGRVRSWQVGADYNHLHDNHFTHSAEMPPQVLRDAEELFQWLSDVGAGKQPEEHP